MFRDLGGGDEGLASQAAISRLLFTIVYCDLLRDPSPPEGSKCTRFLLPPPNRLQLGILRRTCYFFEYPKP